MVVDGVAQRVVNGVARVLPEAQNPAVQAQLLPLVRWVLLIAVGLVFAAGYTLYQRYPWAPFAGAGGVAAVLASLFVLGRGKRPIAGAQEGVPGIGARMPGMPVAGVPGKRPRIRRPFLALCYTIGFVAVVFLAILGTPVGTRRHPHPALDAIRAEPAA
jgi:hypothetical protein